jgi:hypothetical protein
MRLAQALVLGDGGQDGERSSFIITLVSVCWDLAILVVFAFFISMNVGASAAQILRAFAASEKERGLFGENTMRGPASSLNGRRQKKLLKNFSQE